MIIDYYKKGIKFPYFYWANSNTDGISCRIKFSKKEASLCLKLTNLLGLKLIIGELRGRVPEMPYVELGKIFK